MLPFYFSGDPQGNLHSIQKLLKAQRVVMVFFFALLPFYPLLPNPGKSPVIMHMAFAVELLVEMTCTTPCGPELPICFNGIETDKSLAWAVWEGWPWLVWDTIPSFTGSHATFLSLDQGDPLLTGTDTKRYDKNVVLNSHWPFGLSLTSMCSVGSAFMLWSGRG